MGHPDGPKAGVIGRRIVRHNASFGEVFCELTDFAEDTYCIINYSKASAELHVGHCMFTRCLVSSNSQSLSSTSQV
jgi:hypothetical protein